MVLVVCVSDQYFKISKNCADQVDNTPSSRCSAVSVLIH